MQPFRDNFFFQAKKEGYLARSIYKLQEIDTKYQLIKPTSKILELGAYPGSWLQYTSAKIGAKGVIYALDIKPLKWKPKSSVTFFCTNVMEWEQEKHLPKDFFFDLVLSDMAPNTTGIKEKDAQDAFELTQTAHNIALRTLSKKGSFLAKTLQGPRSIELLNMLREHYAQAKIVKPKSSRTQSKEIFLLGLKKR